LRPEVADARLHAQRTEHRHADPVRLEVLDERLGEPTTAYFDVL